MFMDVIRSCPLGGWLSARQRVVLMGISIPTCLA